MYICIWNIHVTIVVKYLHVYICKVACVFACFTYSKQLPAPHVRVYCLATLSQLSLALNRKNKVGSRLHTVFAIKCVSLSAFATNDIMGRALMEVSRN